MYPAAIRTLDPIRVAVWKSRAAPIAPVVVQVPVAGSKISAELIENAPGVPPPTTSTRPSVSRVAECPKRGVLIGAVAENVPVAGSNSSAVAVELKLPSVPPAGSEFG